MAKYNRCDYSRGKFIPISFDKQILPGTLEHTPHDSIGEKISVTLRLPEFSCG